VLNRVSDVYDLVAAHIIVNLISQLARKTQEREMSMLSAMKLCLDGVRSSFLTYLESEIALYCIMCITVTASRGRLVMLKVCCCSHTARGRKER